MNPQVLEDKPVLDNHKEIIKITETSKTTKNTEIIGNKNLIMNLN